MNDLSASNPDEYPVRGKVKLFLGYASGVGKTYTMLAEAHRRKSEHGQDIVIGFVDTHNRPDTQAIAADLETIRLRSIEYRGHFFDEIDIERIVARRPQWVVIDDMAHSNVPGSIHTLRDIKTSNILSEHGISGKLTAMNIQHMAGFTDTVAVKLLVFVFVKQFRIT